MDKKPQIDNGYIIPPYIYIHHSQCFTLQNCIIFTVTVWSRSDFKEHANLIVTTAWVNNTESVILYGFHQNKRSKDNDGNSNDDDDTTDDDDDYDDRTKT